MLLSGFKYDAMTYFVHVYIFTLSGKMPWEQSVVHFAFCSGQSHEHHLAIAAVPMEM